MSPTRFVLAALIAAHLSPAQDATIAPGTGKLLAAWLTELLDLDTAAAKSTYTQVAQAEGVSRALHSIAQARSIEIARVEGDLDGARQMRQASAAERDDSRLQQPLEKDLLEGLRQKPPDTDAEALRQWRSDVHGRLSSMASGRPLRSETRWLLFPFADRIDVAEDDRTRVRRLRTQLVEAYRDHDAARAKQLVELLHESQDDRRAQKRLGLQMLDLRLRGAERAAARFAQASLVAPSQPLAGSDADLATTIDRLRPALAAALRAARPVEREVLGRLQERVERLIDEGQSRAALETISGVPYYGELLLGGKP